MRIKKLLCLLMSMVVLLSFSSCGKTDKLIVKIDELAQKENLEQEDIDSLFEEYHALSDDEKSEIINYEILEQYENVNIEKVNTLKDRISNTSSSADFSELIDIYEEYQSLTSNEKKLIDIDDIKRATELTDIEKAAVAACQYIKKSLKSSSSFELQSAKVIDDLTGTTRYYLVKIQYSATNGFGARNDSDSFQTINSDFENPWYGLSMLNGDYSTALECTPFLTSYLLHDEEPVALDCEKIMYHINDIVN